MYELPTTWQKCCGTEQTTIHQETMTNTSQDLIYLFLSEFRDDTYKRYNNKYKH